MADDAAEWVALRATVGVGDVLGRKLVERFGGAAAARRASVEALAGCGCVAEVGAGLGAAPTLAAARREVARIAAAGARVVALDDPEYPPQLRELRDAPLYLIAKGAPLVAGPAIAIVGARRATAYGLDVARRLAAGLADAGVAVVSGLARGIDGAAHEGTLAARGSTIAVLGSGIDVVYPSEHAALADRLCGSGTLLSEHPVGTAPLPAHFPARNRIIAGMTQGTVVIEAAERSGSLITARLANEAGREVFAVPGRIDSPLSFGAHLLIRDGATLVRGVEDVLEQIAPALRARAPADPLRAAENFGSEPSGVVATLLDLLAAGPLSIDELIDQSARPAPEIIAMMLDLEIRGVVRPLADRQFQLTGRFAGVCGLQ